MSHFLRLFLSRTRYCFAAHYFFFAFLYHIASVPKNSRYNTLTTLVYKYKAHDSSFSRFCFLSMHSAFFFHFVLTFLKRRQLFIDSLHFPIRIGDFSVSTPGFLSALLRSRSRCSRVTLFPRNNTQLIQCLEDSLSSYFPNHRAKIKEPQFLVH